MIRVTAVKTNQAASVTSSEKQTSLSNPSSMGPLYKADIGKRIAERDVNTYTPLLIENNILYFNVTVSYNHFVSTYNLYFNAGNT